MDTRDSVRGDPGLLLVGEWGFQVGTASEADIRKVLNVMKDRKPPNNDKPSADIMFWHCHHHCAAGGVGEWGLRRTDDAEAEDGRYVPAGETDMYQKYKDALSSG